MAPEGPLEGVDHVYYWTRDMDRAVAFYERVLGLTLRHRAGDEWAEFDAGGVRMALHRTTDEPLPPSGTVVFHVRDLEAARWALQQSGATFDGQDAEVPGVGRFATVRDPDGNAVQLIEYGR